ncbi:Beta-galactosidase BoGH2A [termite gut metagenome]|uniref:Beta-galactosidase BoGH2A n=1 Tax=termite gut metagenome TaxID=433724 RepID=A0A5J4ST03_9ZZZZ
MKNLKLLLLVLSFLMAIMVKAQVSFGKPENINDDWLFILNDVRDGQAISLNDRNWSRIDLPHDWSIKSQLSPSLASCTGYLQGGVGWYRKNILIPEENKGKKVYLYFEGVYNCSEVFINGNLLGKRPNGYVSFMYDATPYIEYGKNNIIAVRVDHSQYADSRWYTGSGIYHSVWLVTATPVHISQWGVYAYPSDVNTKQGTLNVEVEVENDLNTTANLTIVNELLKDNKTIAKSSEKLNISANSNSRLITNLRVKNPLLWDLGMPNLCSLKMSVYKNGTIIDETITVTGFRSFTFD